MEAKTTFCLKQSKLCGSFILYVFNISVIIGQNCITLEKERRDLKVLQSLFQPERHKVTNLISAVSKLPDPLGGQVTIASPLSDTITVPPCLIISPPHNVSFYLWVFPQLQKDFHIILICRTL